MSDEPIDIPIDELVARGVYDPSAPDAERRLASIASAMRAGATVDDLVAADDLFTFSASLRMGRGPRRYTIAEAAATAGISVEDASRLSLAGGFPVAGPDEVAFGDDDVELFESFQAAKAFFGEELTVQLARVFGSAMARVADGMQSVFAINVGTQSSERAFDQHDLQRATESAVGLIPQAIRVMELLLRRHMTDRIRPELLLGDRWEGVDALDRAVGFCDLVGYTPLSAQISTVELARLLDRFETVSAEHVAAAGGSIVKLIGDEVMFVAPDARTACEIALRLAETFAATSDLGNVRVGLAAGRVIMREGDYFGPIVNLASRLVKLAPEGGVIAPATFRELSGFTYQDAGTPSLKGFAEPIQLVLVRR